MPSFADDVRAEQPKSFRRSAESAAVKLPSPYLRERFFKQGTFGVFGLEAHDLADRRCDADLGDRLIDDGAARNPRSKNQRKNLVRRFRAEVMLAGHRGQRVRV